MSVAAAAGGGHVRLEAARNAVARGLQRLGWRAALIPFGLLLLCFFLGPLLIFHTANPPPAMKLNGAMRCRAGAPVGVSAK